MRYLLVLIALGLIGVFAVAMYLNPYREGRIWRDGTHQQLGLPPCTFKLVTELPCPSCGLSTSFALFVRGDLWNSLQANFAGTLLAAVLLAYIPWSLVAAFKGRWFYVQSFEWALIRFIVLFMSLLLLRWAIVLLEIKLSIA